MSAWNSWKTLDARSPPNAVPVRYSASVVVLFGFGYHAFPTKPLANEPATYEGEILRFEVDVVHMLPSGTAMKGLVNA